MGSDLLHFSSEGSPQLLILWLSKKYPSQNAS